MKIAIVYASETGNTAQIAQAIREGCQGHEIVAFGPLSRDVGEAELIFVGSWTDKGTCAPVVKEFLQRLHGKRVALFGTAGFGLSEMYFASLSDRFRAEVPEENQVLGYLVLSRGRMPPAVRARYETQLKEKPGDARLENMLRAYDQALSHPDGTDLADARGLCSRYAGQIKKSSAIRAWLYKEVKGKTNHYGLSCPFYSM